ncbi:hypothetical protein ACC691_37395, partial [Rhizobium johnstonii]|uniref:hypothetical protein n=1 Tax=Rhizobium johnstonii TaxID=3019933 RepID=UPI003F9E77F9
MSRQDAGRVVRRRGALGVVAIAAATAGVIAAIGTLAVVAAFSRAVVVPSKKAVERVRVRGLDQGGGTITLDADADTR